MEYKVKNFISSSPFLQGQQQGDPCLANDTFLLKLPLWSLGNFHACHCTWNLDSRLTILVLPSLTKTFSNHFLPGWFLPLTPASSLCQYPLSYFDLSSRTQTWRIRQNLLPLFTHGMRNIDQQTSTFQRVSSSTIDIYLTTQNISTDKANNNLSLTVWGKFSTQTRLKTAHTHTFPSTTFLLQDSNYTISFFTSTPLYGRQTACAVPVAELSDHFKSQPLHLILSRTNDQCSQRH